MNSSPSIYNFCSLIDDIYQEANDVYLHHRFEHNLLQTLYGFIIIIGVVMNASVITIILTKRHLRNMRNYFLIHLAFSDLLLCLLSAPFTLWFTFNTFWEFGDLSCKLVASLQALNTGLSLLTLTAIAWDRYLLIFFPVKWRSQIRFPIMILSGVWILALSMAAPYYFAVGTVKADYGIWNESRYFPYLWICNHTVPDICVEHFRGGYMSKVAFTIMVFLLQYMLPFTGLLFAYIKIAKRALKRPNRFYRLRAHRRRTFMILTVIVFVFGVCWLPSNLYCALEAFQFITFDQKTYIYLHLFGMITTCINPIFYGLLNTNVKEAVETMLRSFATRTEEAETEFADRGIRRVRFYSEHRRYGGIQSTRSIFEGNRRSAKASCASYFQ